MKKLNWNSRVKVKLNDLGKDIFYHRYDYLKDKLGNARIEPRYPEIDVDGFTDFHLWDFMNLYGPYIHMAMKPVVSDINFYIDEEEISND